MREPGHVFIPTAEEVEIQNLRAENERLRLEAPAANKMVSVLNEDIRELRAENKRLRAALLEAERHLVNLQPHIPQACIPSHESFIDSHVDVAITTIRVALADQGKG